MSVSFFKISCDFPDCEMTIVHGQARPPLSAGALPEAVGLLLVAHRWTVDKEGATCVPFIHNPRTESRRRAQRSTFCPLPRPG